uniref:Uncharacterized protein n=1 Tax=Picea sitchensis TaxID=3332 RepID=A0A6B9XQS5_PICSI|nr:hypothetical protein Q903MT_gene5478 [Picea sitchensis]
MKCLLSPLCQNRMTFHHPLVVIREVIKVNCYLRFIAITSCEIIIIVIKLDYGLYTSLFYIPDMCFTNKLCSLLGTVITIGSI